MNLECLMLYFLIVLSSNFLGCKTSYVVMYFFSCLQINVLKNTMLIIYASSVFLGMMWQNKLVF